MAKKQSLVGVCFAGVQKLQTQQQEPPEMTYLTWMGMAAKIQQRNETMKAKGDVLLAELRNNGMDACILKGQALAPYYGDLNNLRQSGDIDVWVKNKSVMELDAYVKGLGLKPHTTAAHVSYEDKDGVEIELHADPAFMRNFLTHRKLVRWIKEFNGSSTEFNLVYMMVHMYHHVLFEGLGLRQLMDYYFVLRTVSGPKFQVSGGDDLTKTIKTPEGSASACDDEIENKISSSSSQTSADSNAVVFDPSGKKLLRLRSGQASIQISIPSVLAVLDSLGMKRFAQGIMWIMKEVFALEDKYLICEANEQYGRLILEDVMVGGNFGHHDDRNKGLHGGTAVGRSLNGLKRNMKFFALGPCEILSSPVWSLWHYVWRKCHGFM